jgi:hypothetical protein
MFYSKAAELPDPGMDFSSHQAKSARTCRIAACPGRLNIPSEPYQQTASVVFSRLCISPPVRVINQKSAIGELNSKEMPLSAAAVLSLDRNDAGRFRGPPIR